jgi:excisionase family DNA binding protein
MESILLTREETADLLHVSLPTLLRIVKSGELRTRKIGGRVMFRTSDVENFVKGGDA